jgi:hypothetical protein
VDSEAIGVDLVRRATGADFCRRPIRKFLMAFSWRRVEHRPIASSGASMNILAIDPNPLALQAAQLPRRAGRTIHGDAGMTEALTVRGRLRGSCHAGHDRPDRNER